MNDRFLCRAAVLIGSCLFVLAGSVAANVLTVRSTADAGGSCPGADCTLRQAIVNAVANDTILFALPANTAITLTSDSLVLTKNLSITGPGANLLTVQRSSASGTPNFRIFRVPAGITATISGLTMSNGSGQFTSGVGDNGTGGGLFSQGTVTITGCAIVGNHANGDGDGGGLYNSSTMTVTNCLVAGNTAVSAGGIYTAGTLTVTGSTLSGNSVTGQSGGLRSTSGTCTITNSTITGNTAVGLSGGIQNLGNTLNVKSTIIALNTDDGTGPDVQGPITSQGYNLIGNTTGATITGTTTGNQLNANPNIGPLQDNGGPTKTHALLSGSSAIEGGVANGTNTDQRGFARPVDDPAVANATSGDGCDIGAYEVQPDQLPGCKSITSVVSNTNDTGTGSLRTVMAAVCAGTTITFAPSVRGTINLTSGELLINKSLTINGPSANLLTVQRSAAAATNFRIFHINGNFLASISGLTIAKGLAPAALGGGISNDNGSLTLTNVTVSGNTADIGAGIYTARAAVISGSTISGNITSGNNAGDGGGGIYSQGGTLALVNSTIAGNTAQLAGGGGQGGGMRSSLGLVTILNSTIVGNSADSGGGIFTSGGTVSLANTIIAQNSSPNGPDLNGAFNTQGSNLIGDVTGGSVSPGLFTDHIGSSGSAINPMLGSLQNNGGPTNTMALQNGSIAINAGDDSAAPSSDQRGAPRAGISDIGAFEFGSNSPALTLSAASSRKTHNTAGTFDINLPLTGTAGVECRSGGASGNHTVVFTFSNPLTSVGGATVSAGTGSVSSSALGADAHQYVVNLTGVTNTQNMTISLANITDSLGNTGGSAGVTASFLLADANGDRAVNSGDATIVRNHSGQATDATNFRADINLDGAINSADATITRAQSGSGLLSSPNRIRAEGGADQIGTSETKLN